MPKERIIKKEKQMKKVYTKPTIRALFSSALTLLVGVSLAFLGNWDPAQNVFIIKVMVFAFLSIVDLCHIVYCAALDSKETLMIDILKKQNTSYQNALSRIIHICQTNSEGINDCIHDFVKNGKYNKTLWNYKKACYNLCDNIFAFLGDLATSKDIEVTYIRLNEKADGEISMYAYSNKANQKPKLLNVKRNIHDQRDSIYYDSKRFIDNNSETIVLYGSDEINIEFYRTTEEKANNPNKYNQFISIPVFCGDSKMIGLLQVALFENCSIANDKAILREVADQLIVPYAHLFLLLHKISKALDYEIHK